jgi:peptidoglycan DL-endopeptidase CwlO
MKRKTLLKLTACGLVGALTIGNFTVAAYAAPTAGVASLASDIATTSSAPTAGFSLALSEVAEKVEDEATVASAQPEVKEVEAPVVKSEYEDKAVAVVDDYVNVRKKPTTDSKAVGKLYKNNVGTVIGEKDGFPHSHLFLQQMNTARIHNRMRHPHMAFPILYCLSWYCCTVPPTGNSHTKHPY